MNATEMDPMDNRRPRVHKLQDIDTIRDKVIRNVEHTVCALRDSTEKSMQLFETMRFQKIGHDPLTGNSQNLVEQLNMTFSILTTLQAVEFLMERHSDAGGFQLSLANAGGRAIRSINERLVAAEAFAATSPASNDKLRKDLKIMGDDKSKSRYVFFIAGASQQRNSSWFSRKATSKYTKFSYILSYSGLIPRATKFP